MDKLRKDITKIFKNEGLKITCETNLIETDYLDVKFNIPKSKYFPFKKPNDNPLYINTSSNHRPQVIKQTPKTISQWLSNISCDEIEFNKVRQEYQNALTESGHKEILKYEPKDANLNRKRRRKRKIIWFNPPFNKNLKTELGRKFFNLFDRHFPKTHKCHKIFNRNNVKLSYSCTENMGMLIKKINKKKLEKVSENRPQLPNTPQLTNCNCRNKQNCPLNLGNVWNHLSSTKQSLKQKMIHLITCRIN